MGRDKMYPDQLTAAVKDNAVETVARVNVVLAAAFSDGVPVAFDQQTKTRVASGWRPAGVNARTQNSATASSHITAEGCDIQDTPDRQLARWCLVNLDVLESVGLWMEDPQWTGGKDPWVHFQTKPPKSGKRVYVPSAQPPIAAKLPEQMGVA